ncbi:MAG: type II secretion system secretin GspD [bacterium]
MADNRIRKMRAQTLRWVLAVLVLPLCVYGAFLTGEGRAQEVERESLGPDDLVSLDFDNADIRVVIKQISELTGRNFLVDEKVRGNVTIITPTKIRIRDIYEVFLSLLHIYGFTAIPSGKVIKILPLREVSRAGVPTVSPSDTRLFSDSDRIVTTFIQLEHADSASLATLLKPLAAREGNLFAYPTANALIITDTAANVRRLTSIINAMDIPSAASDVVVVKLKFAQAKEISGILKELIQDTGDSPQGQRPTARPRRGRAPRAAPVQFTPKKEIKVIPDDRINALIFVAPPSEIVRLKSLVKKLDVPPPPERKRIHVYRLKNALAEELAAVLTQQIEKSDSASGGAPSSRRGLDGTGRRGEPTPPARPRRPVPSRADAGGGARLLIDVAITPDKATNSLIVRASPEDYQSLIEIIEKLDVRRAQVLVEALFAEMTMDKAQEIGIEWRLFSVPDASGKAREIGGTNLPIGSAGQGIINQFAAAPFAGPTGLVLGAAKGLITFGDQTFFDLRGLIRAFQADSDINILSTPQILTTDNEEAEIVVGENRPFVTRSQTTAEGGSTIQNFEFRDIGVKLRITPHISPNRTVSLKLFQEILNFVEESQVGAVVTTKRQATTTVTVEDGQTVVIGGLIRDDKTVIETKVPFLGDIPLIGLLFRSERKTKVKTNLMIFITPHIVTTPEEHQRLTELKRGESKKLFKSKPRSLKERM